MSKPNWPKLCLRSLTSRIGDGIHGTPEYAEQSPYSFINGNNLRDGSIQVFPVTKRVPKSEYEKHYIEFDQNTLFLSINGTLGSLAKYRGEPVILGKSAAYIKCSSISIDFLYYYLQLPSVQQRMWNVATGSTIKNLSLDAIRNLRIPKPSEDEQQKIAAVLSALDAKIDCNNRINAELEAMAKTLYDYWFVQFDFPLDFAQGKPYKSSGGKMVYNPTLKREIPAGWKAGIASDLFDFNPTLSLPMNKEASYIDMNSLPLAGFMTNSPERKLFAGGMKFQNGDVVVARITPCLENGKTALISLLKDAEVGFGSTEFIVIRGKKSPLSAFAAQLSRSVSFRQFAISNMTGTSGRKRIDASTLETFSLPLPPEKLLLVFEKMAASFFKNMANNTKENQHLTQLRDWLLPMLMNGQVMVV